MMKAWVRILAVFGLLIGMVVTAAPVAADGINYSVRTLFPYPDQYTNESVSVRFSQGDANAYPVSGIFVHSVWNYRTTISTFDQYSLSNGEALLVRNIADATCGYTVRVDIFVGDAQQQIDSAYFTPCDNNSDSAPSFAAYPPAPAPAYNPPQQQSFGGPVSGSGGICPDGYPIKGNDNSGIYHVSGGQFYDATNAYNCFATEQDASNAGYRKSYR